MTTGMDFFDAVALPAPRVDEAWARRVVRESFGIDAVRTSWVLGVELVRDRTTLEGAEQAADLHHGRARVDERRMEREATLPAHRCHRVHIGRISGSLAPKTFGPERSCQVR